MRTKKTHLFTLFLLSFHSSTYTYPHSSQWTRQQNVFGLFPTGGHLHCVPCSIGTSATGYLAEPAPHVQLLRTWL